MNLKTDQKKSYVVFSDITCVVFPHQFSEINRVSNNSIQFQTHLESVSDPTSYRTQSDKTIPTLGSSLIWGSQATHTSIQLTTNLEVPSTHLQVWWFTGMIHGTQESAILTVTDLWWKISLKTTNWKRYIGQVWGLGDGTKNFHALFRHTTIFLAHECVQEPVSSSDHIIQELL